MARPKKLRDAGVTTNMLQMLTRLRDHLKACQRRANKHPESKGDYDGDIGTWEPLATLAELACNKNVEAKHRIVAASELAKYIYPQFSKTQPVTNVNTLVLPNGSTQTDVRMIQRQGGDAFVTEEFGNGRKKIEHRGTLAGREEILDIEAGPENDDELN